MGFVTVEIDIAPDGAISASPNPVVVASGDNLLIHINSNLSEASRFTVRWPRGPSSPFGDLVFGRDHIDVEQGAVHCQGSANGVNWPAGVDHATIGATVHGSPVLGRLQLEVLRALAAPSAAPIARPMPPRYPYVIQNYYFSQEESRSMESAGEYGEDVVDRNDTWEVDVNHQKKKIVGPLKKDRIYRIHNKGSGKVKILVDGADCPPPLEAGDSRDVEGKSIEVQFDGSTSASGTYEGPK